MLFRATQLTYFMKYLAGASFDAQEFHRQVLALRPAPIDMVKDHVEEWIKASERYLTSNAASLRVTTQWLFGIFSQIFMFIIQMA